MPMLNEDEKNRLFMTLDAQTNQLKKLEQGMYGDKALGIKGLIEDMEYVKNWIAKSKIKIAYAAGIFTAIGFGIKAVWEWLTRK